MAKGKYSQLYTVINGCNAGDKKPPHDRYEIKDPYDASKHTKAVTDALLEMKCIEPVDESEYEEEAEAAE